MEWRKGAGGFARRPIAQGSIDMGAFSIWHWLIVLAVVLLLFGRGKIPELMGDVAKGIKSFKKGMSDDEPQAAQERRALEDRDTDIVARDTHAEKTRI